MMTSRIFLSFLMWLLLINAAHMCAQDDSMSDFNTIRIDTVPSQVQPMTGIVFWQNQYTNLIKESISLEFNYMLFNDIVDENGNYNWEAVESRLNDIASRKHQSILRFRYVYPGYKTSVPDYIKNLEDYEETKGSSEGKTTWFPDWTHPELKKFTLDFYTKFAERYDNDPRLAFIQIGFGLWAEYHIYSGPFELGVTFPSKEFQADFFRHLDTTFINTPISCSIDAASNKYSPFEEQPELLELTFGNFDDSFMHKNFGKPGNYNTESWKFFGEDRYKTAPAGGEFSYYSTYDQEHVLDLPDGPYEHPFEFFAEEYHISYMIGNGQANYQTPERIKEASKATGYKFKIVSFKTRPDSSVVVVKNIGVAPFYFDAFIAINGVGSNQSLKFLSPGESIVCGVSAGGKNAVLSIESNRLVQGQSIGYWGTENYLASVENIHKPNNFKVYPTILNSGQVVNIERIEKDYDLVKIEVWSINGNMIQTMDTFQNNICIDTGSFKSGLYVIQMKGPDLQTQIQKIYIN